MKLTPEQSKLRERISFLKTTILLEQQNLGALIESCKHVLRPLTKEELKDEWMSVGAKCEVCNENFAWRCKKSPDSVCHYYSENGKVELIDGRMIDIPKEHNTEYETDDCCIFCGLPDERK